MQADDACFSTVKIRFIQHDCSNLGVFLLEYDSLDSVILAEDHIEIVQHLD